MSRYLRENVFVQNVSMPTLIRLQNIQIWSKNIVRASLY